MNKYTCIILTLIATAILPIYAQRNPIKSLTYEILKNYSELKGADILTRPRGLDLVYETEHFKVWYTVVGDSAPDLTDQDPSDSIPDWINRTGEILEYCWDVEITQKGFRPPRPDSSSLVSPEGVGGDDRLDVYVLNVRYYGAVAFGVTVPEEIIYEDGQRIATAYMQVENDYAEPAFESYQGRELEALQVTCAHEFCHVIQFNYHISTSEFENFQECYWWYEATSVFMEDEVYDNVNDYIQYLAAFLEYPDLALDSYYAGHHYGSGIFPIFISEKYDPNLIREIWENFSLEWYIFPTLDATLESHGINLDIAFQEFSVWNIFTGERADTSLFYSEGNSFPEVYMDDLEWDSTGSQNWETDSRRYACSYFRFPYVNIKEGLSITFAPDTHFQGAYSLVGLGLSGTDNPDTIILADSSSVIASLPGLWRFSNAIVITQLYNSSHTESGCSFQWRKNSLYTIPYPDRAVFEEPYPNPFIIEKDQLLVFPYILQARKDLALFIYNVSGDLVFSIHKDLQNPGSHQQPETALVWDGTNQSGEKVAAGIYAYKLIASEDSKTGTLAVFRID
ncbi:hypothetical protein JW877_03445 [bacterium]|nr:hypothetical protein [bacterium]